MHRNSHIYVFVSVAQTTFHVNSFNYSSITVIYWTIKYGFHTTAMLLLLILTGTFYESVKPHKTREPTVQQVYIADHKLAKQPHWYYWRRESEKDSGEMACSYHANWLTRYCPQHTDTIPGTFATSYANPTKSYKSSDSSADNHDSGSNFPPCALVNS
jgi:hypothetical protein